MSDQIWVAVISTIGVLGVPIIIHTVQLRKSRQVGVKSEDVQAQPAAAPAPGDGWDRLVRSLEARVVKLEQGQEKLEQELSLERDLRWLAIQYIRRLHSWIAAHMPSGEPPPPPADLAPYIILPGRDHP